MTDTLVMLRAVKGITTVSFNRVTICPGNSNAKSYSSSFVHDENVVAQKIAATATANAPRKTLFIYLFLSIIIFKISANIPKSSDFPQTMTDYFILRNNYCLQCKRFENTFIIWAVQKL